MRTKKKASRARKLTECSCYEGWVCEDHPGKPFNHDGCGGAGGLCTNPDCDKDPDSVFSDIHCRVVRERKPADRKTSINA